MVPLPPLRQRRQDIPLLAHHFLSLYARRLGRPTLRLAPESLARLMDYSWPGNIRELENTLHNAVLLSKEEENQSCPAAPGDAQRRPGAGERS
ncbi:alkanesulfonates-binding protein [Klebsiella pneumoniae]|uniref:Alkanesulfonates-binding protein n=1 Tax=Klebsiella pneumoniae TaxID=573 RepID=A0A377WRA3_KLEPN|nr:alkanesulfonates-binding protein [Klebsiella pneumoniae]